ncbi:hypothetical protein ACWD4O_44670 [Streptomyces sp. NPDC002623]
MSSNWSRPSCGRLPAGPLGARIGGVGLGHGELEEGDQGARPVADLVVRGHRLLVPGHGLVQPAPEQCRRSPEALDVRGHHGIVEPTAQLSGLRQRPVRRRMVALEQRGPGGHPQRLGPGGSGLRGGRQGPLQPPSALAEEAVGAPVEAQCGGRRQR